MVHNTALAGTDADVLLEIVGDVCTSSRKPLVDPTGQRDLFERGQVWIHAAVSVESCTQLGQAGRW